MNKKIYSELEDREEVFMRDSIDTISKMKYYQFYNLMKLITPLSDYDIYNMYTLSDKKVVCSYLYTIFKDNITEIEKKEFD